MVMDEDKSIMKVINITLDLVIVIEREIRNKDIKIRTVAATPFLKNIHTRRRSQERGTSTSVEISSQKHMYFENSTNTTIPKRDTSGYSTTARLHLHLRELSITRRG